MRRALVPLWVPARFGPRCASAEGLGPAGWELTGWLAIYVAARLEHRT